MVLTAGIISLISAGSNGATLSTTAASGGTGPYTQQWYRDTSGAGFTPGIGNIIHSGTALILSGAGLVPNTTYYYKVIYTDATTSTVTSAAFVVTTLPASQGMNQFAMAAILGSLDLQSGPKNVVAAQVDASQSTPLYPGQPVKFVNSPYGIPTVVAAGSSMPNGYIVYDQKSPSFTAGMRCELARTETCIWLYATSVIDRGSMVILDPNVAAGVQQANGISTLPIVGEAFDEAIASGQLIRIILNVPSNVIDIAVIVSNILEIDSSLTEDLVTQHLLRSIINGIPSNPVAVQIPVPSPTNNNLMSMDESGYNKDSGVSITDDSMSNDNSHIPTTEAMQSAILSGVTAGYTFQGEWDASGGTYPTLDHLGAPITMGDNWRITVGGTLPGGKVVFEGDNLLALINVPGQTGSNWSVSIGTGVRKFNDRDGLVYPENDDYSLAQITGAVAALALKSDLTYVDAQLALKASLTYVDAQLALKASLVQLALKANLAGAAFSGAVTVLTPVNPTEAARKDYVDAAILAAAPAYSTVALSGNFNITSQYLLTVQSTDAHTMRLPDAATTLPNAIYTIFLIASAANATITVPAGQYLNDVLNGTVSIVATPGAVVSFRSNGNNYWVQIDEVAALAKKANLASPTFTGNVTVPVPSATTDAARKDYVDAGLATKADAAATTAALALKANLASPTFTGNVTAPNIITSSMLVSSKGGSLATVDDTGLMTPSFALNILKGYKLSWASNTTLGLTAGSANAFDFNHPTGGSIIYTQTGNVVINIANVGVVNGLDTGAAANSTNYYVYAIFHGTTTSLNGGMLSTVSPVFGPNLPAGYVASRYIGRVRRDSSGIFIPFVQSGAITRTTTFNGAAANTQVLSGGVSASYTTLGLTTFLPPGVRKGIMRIDYAPASVFASLNFRETGSTVGTTTGLISYGPGSISQFRDMLPFLCNGSQSIDYLQSAAGDTANFYIYSYEEDLQ